MSNTDQALSTAIAQSYADFRAEQAARGRPVCDAFEPCKAAQSEPHPWSTAPDFTPCGRCGWSKRTHDPGIECGPINPVRVPDREGAHLMPLHCPGCGREWLQELRIERGPRLSVPHVATLPTGERVELPAGTVLREDTRPAPIRLASEAEERAVLARAAEVETRKDMSGRCVVVTDHEGQRYELARVSPWEATKAVFGPYVPMYQRRVVTSVHPATEREIQERRLRDLREGVEAPTVLADLTERVGLPREMAPSEWPTPRAMAEIACRKRTLGQGFQSGFEEGVTAERARFEAAPLVSLDDYAKPRT